MSQPTYCSKALSGAEKLPLQPFSGAMAYVTHDYLRNPGGETSRNWQDVADCLRETLESFLDRANSGYDRKSVKTAIGILSRDRGQKGFTRALAELCVRKEMPPQLKDMIAASCAEVKSAIQDAAEGIKRHVTRRTGQRKKGSKPGPKRSVERIGDLKRVHHYVAEDGLSVNRACEIVAAENMEKADRLAHYASAASLRDAYPAWREECRRAGVRR